MSQKQKLLAYKETLLQEIRYSERSIHEFHGKHSNSNYVDSDSEDELLPTIDMGPSISDLKSQQVMLKTCLQATQELTGVTVLQSEDNILTEEPKFEGETLVKEPGTWREVTADCRVDLVPFSITFYIHIPHRKFGAPSYRGLHVNMVKPAHEVELAISILNTLVRPSDAIEVIRSYAEAYRSRRSSIAHLANKYGDCLKIDIHAEGGFVLTCANLEIAWRVENNGSPVAPFHQKLNFNLDYMQEAYLKTIAQAHKQLANPSLETDERTLLLAKIINACLEAKGNVTDESMELDVESRPASKRDEDMMAPPKSLPVKAKNSKSFPHKRSMTNGNNDNVKRMKTVDADDNNSDRALKDSRNIENTAKENVRKSQKKVIDTAEDKEGNRGRSKSVAGSTTKNSNSEKTPKENIESNKKTLTKSKKDIPVAKNKHTSKKLPDINDGVITTNVDKSQSKASNVETNRIDAEPVPESSKTNLKNKVKNVPNSKNLTDPTDALKQRSIDKNNAKTKIVSNPKNFNPTTKSAPDKNREKAGNKNSVDKAKVKPTNVATVKKNSDNIEKPRDSNKIVRNAGDFPKDPKTKTKNIHDSAVMNKKSVTSKVKDTVDKANTVAKQKILKTTKATNNITEKGAEEKTDRRGTFIINKNDEEIDNNQNSNTLKAKSAGPSNLKARNDRTVSKFTEKNVASIKTKDKFANRLSNKPSVKERLISGNTNDPKIASKIAYKSQNVLKTGNTKAANIGNKIFDVGKENSVQRSSKIPQKLTPISERAMKRNPLRISPRIISNQFKTPQNLNKQKIIKTTTNIPRLLKKPAPKPR